MDPETGQETYMIIDPQVSSPVTQAYTTNPYVIAYQHINSNQNSGLWKYTSMISHKAQTKTDSYALIQSKVSKEAKMWEKNSHQLLSPVPIIHGNNLSGLAPFAPLPHHHIGNPVIHFISEMAEKL